MRTEGNIQDGGLCLCEGTYSLQSSLPVCTSWAASPCNHRNWTAALVGEEEVVISANSGLTVNTVTTLYLEKPFSELSFKTPERLC